mmetsp:Transcript_8853/g.21643  ORF Transcript_8853/g.21643 Transcript_8853/m.21643 type:complete len:99 (-) Transcript_8853:387-683(-)
MLQLELDKRLRLEQFFVSIVKVLAPQMHEEDVLIAGRWRYSAEKLKWECIEAMFPRNGNPSILAIAIDTFFDYADLDSLLRTCVDVLPLLFQVRFLST